MPAFLAPGIFVRHPTQPDWGLGQVQSVVGNRVTVNFENAGKRLIIADRVALIEVSAGDGDE
ncbi:MAG: DUF3553 domain-containing protein [Alphaproteobacteria bacterium]